jgi:hypothetical protein
VYGSDPKEIPDLNHTDICLVFHGAGGPDANTDVVIGAAKAAETPSVDRYVGLYDWQPWLGNILRAAYDGQRVGKTIGKQIAHMHMDQLTHASMSTEQRSAFSELRQLRKLHVVGVSVGAFAADSCVRAYQNEFNRLQKGSSSSGRAQVSRLIIYAISNAISNVIIITIIEIVIAIIHIRVLPPTSYIY